MPKDLGKLTRQPAGITHQGHSLDYRELPHLSLVCRRMALLLLLPLAPVLGQKPAALDIESHRQKVRQLLQARPLDRQALKEALHDIGSIHVLYRSPPHEDPLKDGWCLGGKFYVRSEVALHRPATGAVPDAWLEDLAAPTATYPDIHYVQLGIAPTPEVGAERDQLLAADREQR